MKSSLDMLRVWAAVTGIALVGWILLLAFFGHTIPELLPMLIASILGFELALLAQDFRRKKERRRG